MREEMIVIWRLCFFVTLLDHVTGSEDKFIYPCLDDMGMIKLTCLISTSKEMREISWYANEHAVALFDRTDKTLESSGTAELQTGAWTSVSYHTPRVESPVRYRCEFISYDGNNISLSTVLSHESYGRVKDCVRGFTQSMWFYVSITTYWLVFITAILSYRRLYKPERVHGPNA